MEKNRIKYKVTCLRCGKSWDCRSVHPKECCFCRSRSWDTPATGKENVVYIPIPKVDHSEKKTLPFIGAKCPYCRGTTGLDGYRGVAFCYSCDYCWTPQGSCLGVIVGIGARR
jgi:hypothetical protein